MEQNNKLDGRIWKDGLTLEQDLFYLEISQFIHFMIQILFYKSNGVQSVSSF